MFNEIEVQKHVNSYVATGMPKREILMAVLRAKEFAKLNDKSKADLQDYAASLVDSHDNYKLVQYIMDSKIIRLQNLKSKVKVYHPVLHETHEFSLEHLNFILKPSVVMARTIVGFTDYNPRRLEKLYETSNGLMAFNTYEPPFWLKDYFYRGLPVPAEGMPELYQKFFEHLLDGDEASYNYLINWMANSLRAKNMSMLFALGPQGVGKGLTASIIQELHGFGGPAPNAMEARGTVLESQFNGFLEDKTFIHFAEVQIKTSKEVANFKTYIDERIQTEKKGQDSKATTNYANIFLSANNMQDVKVSHDDRRMAFINLTNKKLNTRPDLTNDDLSDYRNQLLKPENIAKLGAYLWHYPVDHKLLQTNFISKTLTDLRKCALLDWEKHFIASYCRQHAGKSILLTQAIEELEVDLNMKLKLTARSFEQLQQKLVPLLKDKKLFKLLRWIQDNGSRLHMLDIAELTAQPEENFIDATEINE